MRDPVANREERFTSLYVAHAGAVYGYARRRLATREDAEDAVVDTFTVVWRRLDEVPVEARPWLLGVARRVVANRFRADRSRIALAERLRSARAGEVEVDRPVSPELDPIVVRSLQELSSWEREVLFLLHWEGLSNSEAAVVMGCPTPLLTLRVHRARRRLARELSRFEERHAIAADATSEEMT